MKTSPRARHRSLALAISLAIFASFVLPCVCDAERPVGGHCGSGAEGGVKAAMAPCCCGALPTAFEVTARLIPTSHVATPITFAILPVADRVLDIGATPPSRRPAHSPPAPTVLRV